jgi:hypothetical protein
MSSLLHDIGERDKQIVQGDDEEKTTIPPAAPEPDATDMGINNTAAAPIANQHSSSSLSSTGIGTNLLKSRNMIRIMNDKMCILLKADFRANPIGGIWDVGNRAFEFEDDGELYVLEIPIQPQNLCYEMHVDIDELNLLSHHVDPCDLLQGAPPSVGDLFSWNFYKPRCVFRGYSKAVLR